MCFTLLYDLQDDICFVLVSIHRFISTSEDHCIHLENFTIIIKTFSIRPNKYIIVSGLRARHFKTSASMFGFF